MLSIIQVAVARLSSTWPQISALIPKRATAVSEIRAAVVRDSILTRIYLMDLALTLLTALEGERLTPSNTRSHQA